MIKDNIFQYKSNKRTQIIEGGFNPIPNTRQWFLCDNEVIGIRSIVLDSNKNDIKYLNLTDNVYKVLKDKEVLLLTICRDTYSSKDFKLYLEKNLEFEQHPIKSYKSKKNKTKRYKYFTGLDFIVGQSDSKIFETGRV